MKYLITGGTGFIGRHVIERLLARGDTETVFVLVREGSGPKFEALAARFPDAGEKLQAVEGDITHPGVVSDETFARLKDAGVARLYSLAAIYDMALDDATAQAVNVEGTRNVVNLANRLGNGIELDHTSSVAVAGINFHGRFTEESFDEGQKLDHPYYRTKYDSEKIVREESRVPTRIYRPGAVVGDSRTGEMDKVDGPYYFFKAVQRLAYAVPKWLPLVGLEGGSVPLAPVDYVAAAIDVLSHKPGTAGQTFHLFQAPTPSVGQLMEILFEAAKGPTVGHNVDTGRATPLLKKMISNTPKAVADLIAKQIDAPFDVLGFAFNTAVFEDRATRQALAGTGVQAPDLRDYVDKIWTYWEQFLDRETDVPMKLRRAVSGKVILITGASSGIGLAAAKKLGAAGARLILVARGREKLEQAKAIIEAQGGEAYVYPADLTSLEAIDACAAAVLNDFGRVDILINNAGRSIRRAVMESLDRFHDYERTMQLNYFGCVRLINAILPSMVKQKSGHIINISSIGVLTNVPRFSAYVASKAALDAFSRCLSAEVKSYNVELTAIYMPLVRTPMIAPTKIYDYVPTWSPFDAADVIAKAIVERPKKISTALGTAAALSYAVAPKVNDFFLSKGFRLFPSSAAAKGAKPGAEASPKPTLEQRVFTSVFRGDHW